MKDKTIWIVGAIVLIFLFVNMQKQPEGIEVEYYKNGEKVNRNLFSAAFIKYDQVRFNIYASNTGNLDIVSWEIKSGNPQIFADAFPQTSNEVLKPGEQNKIIFTSGLIDASDLAVMVQPVNFQVEIEGTDEFGNTMTKTNSLSLEFKESIGADAFIVSKDGTGDFDSISEAVNASTSTGQVILIKKGTYIINSGELTFKNNLTFRGEGVGTIIEFTGTTSKYIDFNEKDNILFENLRINLKGDLRSWGGADVLYHMDVSACTGLKFYNVEFYNYAYDTGSNPGNIGIFSADTNSRFELVRSKVADAGDGNLGAVFLDCTLTSPIITNNDAGTINLIAGDSAGATTNATIMNNKFGRIILLNENLDDCIISSNIITGIMGGDDGSMDRNKIIGNTMTTNVYMGEGSNYNSVTGNVHGTAHRDYGTGNVISGDVQY